jgi:hypothetical protein
MNKLLGWWKAIPEGIREKVIAGLIVLVIAGILKGLWKRIVAKWKGSSQAPEPPAPTPPVIVNVNVPPSVLLPAPEKPILPPVSHLAPGSNLPRPPAVGFVGRKDANQGDFVTALKGELHPGNRAFVALSGSGGKGKTVLAGECARQLEGVYDRRVIWTSAEGRGDYSLSTLLDEVTSALGDSF